MVLHETKGMAEPVIMPDDIGQEGHKALAVGILGDNGRTGITARGDVVEGTGKCNASGSCHRYSTAQSNAGFKA